MPHHGSMHHSSMHHSSMHTSSFHPSSMHHYHGRGVPMVPGTMAFTVQMFFLMVVFFGMGAMMLVAASWGFGTCILIPGVLFIVLAVVVLLVALWSWSAVKAGGPSPLPPYNVQQPGQPPYYQQQPPQPPYYEQPPPQPPYNQRPPSPGAPPPSY